MSAGLGAAMIVRAGKAGGFIRANAAFLEEVGFSQAELGDKPFLDWVDPKDRDVVRAMLESGEGSCCAGHRTRSGGLFMLDLRVGDEGEGAIVLGRAAGEIPLPHDDESDATVRGTLETIARIVEEQNPGYRCSILLVADGRFVRGAGPSLPEEYNAAIDGHAIGPTVGSCGTAIYWNVPIVAVDIQNDPLWAPFAELTKAAGVGACWSHPFTSKNGRVLGALALYAPEPRVPTQEQLSRLRAAARMTGLAVERGRAEEALREQRERELELEAQLRQAAKMEALGVLAGGVAHDFNNVLSAILGNAELALEMSEPDGDVADMLRAVVTASERAGNFCRQMLAYAGRATLGSSRIELGELVPQVNDLARAALSKKASLEYALHHEPIFVKGDENQLLQVILNLVTNAAEALGDSEGKIVVRSELLHHDAAALARLAPHDDVPAGGYVHLTVTDTGCGMDAETMTRIFDPFFTTKFAGRGLGLAAVQGIVRGHGGLIVLDSELGKGTTFTILLPVVSGPEQEETEVDSPAAQAVSKHVLVVDDEEAVRSILTRRLRRAGYEVTEAEDGQRAIDSYSEDPDAISCVLLDLSMPKLGGEEVYRELRALRHDVPIVVMSGYAEQEVVKRFEGNSLAGTLQKPIRGADLLATIRAATT